METFFWLVLAVLVVVPMWKIFGRVGMNPALSLIAVVPGVGGIVCLALLAFGDWPRASNRT